jgi:hypothetical protein
MGDIPVPTDAILTQEDGTGTFADGTPGPVSENALVFDGTNFMEFDTMTIGGPLSFCMWAKFSEAGIW